MVASSKKRVFRLQKQILFRIKRYGADYARDKMFKVFSRPQIDLEDIMKFDKVAAYVAENDLDQEILEQAEIQVKYSGYIEKERNNADKLLHWKM
jgi:tRNA U34 5-carboxymethylaminomethyl modifying enzyme MnmG/GidA